MRRFKGKKADERITTQGTEIQPRALVPLSLIRRTPADAHTRTTQALREDVDETRHLLENGAAGAHEGLSGHSHLSTSREPAPLRRHGTFNISSFPVAGFQTTPSVSWSPPPLSPGLG